MSPWSLATFRTCKRLLRLTATECKGEVIVNRAPGCGTLVVSDDVVRCREGARQQQAVIERTLSTTGTCR